MKTECLKILIKVYYYFSWIDKMVRRKVDEAFHKNTLADMLNWHLRWNGRNHTECNIIDLDKLNLPMVDQF